MTAKKDRPESDVTYDLEEVDVLRERLEASYTEAKEALDATDGDVVAALAYIEAKRGETASTLAGFAQEVVEEVRRVVAGGLVKSAKVTLRGQPLFTASLALAGVAGAAVVILGALISQCGVEVAVGECEDEGH
jgi:anti-sigma factor RsiW